MAALPDTQDTALVVMAACDAFSDFLTDVILREKPGTDRATILMSVRPEVYSCAFDVAYAQWSA